MGWYLDAGRDVYGESIAHGDSEQTQGDLLDPGVTSVYDPPPPPTVADQQPGTRLRIG